MKKGSYASTTQDIVKALYLKVCAKAVLYILTCNYIVSIHIGYQEVSEADMLFMSTEWLAHENAVFDIAWVPGEAQLVSMTNYLIIPLYR